ncbi:MAG: cell wall hydrolase [Oscillospiraceae bacterium]|nr:cell wall hydrolase [Oscillospiraceae bacterium]
MSKRTSKKITHLTGVTAVLLVLVYVYFTASATAPHVATAGTMYAPGGIITAVGETAAYSASTATVRYADLRTMSPDVISTYNRQAIVELMAGDTPPSPVAVEPEAEAAGSALTEEEKRMISRVAVNADFTDENSLLATIQTIYNRLHDSRFPNSVEGVLRQRNQFEACDVVHKYAVPHYDYDRIAALIDRVWSGEDIFGGANVLYYSHYRVPSHKISRGLVFVSRYGQTNFYRQK